jgi:hypothetical protein
MEEQTIGWNYEHINPSGRNVFLFRDADHASATIQDRLTEEVELAINENKFKYLFSEGFLGKYRRIPPFLTEERFREIVGQPNGTVIAVDMLGYRLHRMQNPNFCIYGVDNPELIKLHITLFNIIYQIESEYPIDADLLSTLKNQTTEISNRRTLYSANTIINLMNQNNLRSAGLIFGAAHTPIFLEELRRDNIGCALYYPGQTQSNEEDIREYVKTLTGRVK